jgi:hypothetical protein
MANFRDAIWEPIGGTHTHGNGHRHVWTTPISRRRVLGGSAVLAGAIAGGYLLPAVAQAANQTDNPEPRPIKGTIPGLRVNRNQPADANDPSTLDDPSTITDFDGAVGEVHLQGTGTGTDHRTGLKLPLFYDVDNRFMRGRYVALDGKVRHATFGFI